MSGLPNISIRTDVPAMAAEGWDAFVRHNHPVRFFLRDGEMVEFVEHRDRTSLSAVTFARFVHTLRRVASWTRGGVDKGPPQSVAHDMFAEPRKPLPFLERMWNAPAFVPPGVLLRDAGYHPLSRTYLALDSQLVVGAIPEQPTSDQLRAAVELYTNDLLVDFPFVADRDRAHALALALLPFVRSLIPGPTPLHLIRKPMPGAGATLMAKSLLAPFVGQATPASEAKSNEEWRKRLTAAFRRLPSYIWIDNLGDRLDSVALSTCLSSESTSDRLMQTSDEIELHIHCAWVATGNNPTLSPEIARRTVPISIDPQMERPQERAEFKHRLPDWAITNRARLIEAACVMIQAWIAAGKPAAPNLAPLGTFEAWSEVMGGILHVCGVRGFLEDQGSFYANHDDEGDAMRRFVDAWWNSYQDQVVQVATLLPLAAQVDGLGITAGDHGSSVRLGSRLRREVDRIYAGVQIQSPGTSGHARQYRLRVHQPDSRSTPTTQRCSESALRALP